MSKELVRVKNIGVKFGKKYAVNDCTADFFEGESVLIAGRNGAGKSTFLRCLGGQLIPDSGKVEFQGIGKKDIGIITESLSLYENMRVAEAVDYHHRIFGVTDGSRYMLKNINIDNSKKIKSLSSGERAIFHLSLLLDQDPRFLMIDEIVYKMDAYIRDLFLDALIDLIDMKNATFLMVNHTFSDTGKIPDRVMIMDNGKFIIDEKREELLNNVRKVNTGQKELNVPSVIYSEKSEFGNIYFLYPYPNDLHKGLRCDVENISLGEIVKAFMGGSYVKERI